MDIPTCVCLMFCLQNIKLENFQFDEQTDKFPQMAHFLDAKLKQKQKNSNIFFCWKIQQNLKMKMENF